MILPTLPFVPSATLLARLGSRRPGHPTVVRPVSQGIPHPRAQAVTQERPRPRLLAVIVVVTTIGTVMEKAPKVEKAPRAQRVVRTAKVTKAPRAQKVVRTAKVTKAQKGASRKNQSNLGQIITGIGTNIGRKTSGSLKPLLHLYLLWLLLTNRQWMKVEFTAMIMGQ